MQPNWRFFLLFGSAIFASISGTVSANAGKKAWMLVRGDRASDVYNSSAGEDPNNLASLIRGKNVSRLGDGKYDVYFPNLGTDEGVVHVSSYGGKHYCSVNGWEALGSRLKINVNCFDIDGNPADSQFSVLFLDKPEVSSKGAAYLLADMPAATAPYEPNGARQWNSSGGLNSVSRTATGVYEATLPGLWNDSVKGAVLVTAHGDRARRCNYLDMIRKGSSDVIVRVACFGPDGAAADSEFTLSLIRDVSLGTAMGTRSEMLLSRGGYVLADKPSEKFYTPVESIQKNYSPPPDVNDDKNLNSVKRLAIGSYLVVFPSLAADYHPTIQITAGGDNGEYCTLRNWGADSEEYPNEGTRVFITCHNAKGEIADVKFTMLYLNQPMAGVARIQSTVDSGKSVKVKIYYGTDRNDDCPQRNENCFGGSRAGENQFSYGSVEVSIPGKDYRNVGELEGPYLWSQGIEVISVTKKGKDLIFDEIKAQIAKPGKKKQVFIFIHGYNNTFRDAARRTAQIYYDSGFFNAGEAIFYSWPSDGGFEGLITSHLPTTGLLNLFGTYMPDEDDVSWSIPHIRDFIKDVMDKTEANKVHLIAHSMGTRALSRALLDQHDGLSQAQHNKIKEIILAAPDIDAEIFLRDIAPQIGNRQSRVTLYASEKDQALKASAFVHGNLRIGGIDASNDMSSYLSRLPQKIELIDVTAAIKGDTHSAFAASDLLIKDVGKILIDGTEISKRCNLISIPLGASAAYWVYDPSTCSQ